jgi:cytochrome c1
VRRETVLRFAALGAALGAAAAALSACGARTPAPAWEDFGGDAGRGKLTIVRSGCGSCHEIPGVPDAHGLTGPSLAHFARRTMVAGMLPNTPDNLARWVRDPQGVIPNNAMPNAGLSEAQARDVAAYLYSLD